MTASAAMITLLTVAVPARASTGSAHDSSIAEVPVAFTVVNTNTSGSPCVSDGAPYAIRGHLTGPAELLASRQAPAVTVYLFGMDAGEWNWNFDAVPGYDYTEQIAAAGHISLTIDELGYGTSDHPPDGNLTCVGAQADVTHQIIEQLRAGTYATTGHPIVQFQRVALAGHDVGALVAEVEAYSYADIDALIEVTWADQGHTPFIVQRSVTASTQWCTTGSDASPQPVTYTRFATEDDWHSWIFHDADPAVVDATDRLRNANPCGIIRTLVAAVVAENPYSLKSAAGADPGNSPVSRLHDIAVPVLIVFGAEDTQLWTHQGEQEQAANFSGSRDTTTIFIPDAAHFPMFERSAPQFVADMHTWLHAHHV